MTKSEHQRAPWRDPSREHEVEAERVRTAVNDMAKLMGARFIPDEAKAKAISDPPAVRPPPEHAGKLWHWVATPEHPLGEPVQWLNLPDRWRSAMRLMVYPGRAATFGWRYIAPCEPPTEELSELWKLYDAVDAMYEEGRASRWGDLYQAFIAVRKLKANNSPDETAVDRS